MNVGKVGLLIYFHRKQVLSRWFFLTKRLAENLSSGFLRLELDHSIIHNPVYHGKTADRSFPLTQTVKWAIGDRHSPDILYCIE